MLRISAPSGDEILIPESLIEDQAYFATLDERAKAYLESEGYVVVKVVTR